MPDTTTTPPPVPAPGATPPQPPHQVRQPTDISNAFLTSLTKAMDLEKSGAAPAPATPPPAAPDPSKYGGNLGHVVKTLIKEAKDKDDAAKAAAANPPAIVASPTTAAVAPASTPPVAPPVAATTTPPPARDAVVDKFKLQEIPQQKPAPLPTSLSPLNLDLSGLDEDERAEMETAVFAEQKHPDRYKGHAQRVLDYLKQHKRVVGEIESAGDEDVEDSSKYKAFVKANKPAITNAERRKLDQERISYQAAQEAKAEMSSQLEDLRKQIAETRAGPVIERSLNDFRTVVETILPKEDDPIVSQISNSFRDTAVHAAEQFIKLSNKQISYDPANPIHRGMADFIEDQAGLFQKTGDPGLKRGKQTFVSRATYNTMAPEQRTNHFTFTDDDVLRILAVNAKMNAEQTIANERKRLEQAGYTRSTPRAGAAVVTPPAQVIPDPSPRTSVGMLPPEPTVTSKPKDPFHDYLMTGTVPR